MTTEAINYLAWAAWKRRTLIMADAQGTRHGVLPLWPVEGGRLAVTWTGTAAEAYLATTLDDGWRLVEGWERGSIEVPPVNLVDGVSAARDGRRAIIEALALASRFGLDVSLWYQKASNGTAGLGQRRELAQLAIRGGRVVAADLQRNEPRAFLFARTTAVQARVDAGVTWSDGDYHRPGEAPRIELPDASGRPSPTRSGELASDASTAPASSPASPSSTSDASLPEAPGRRDGWGAFFRGRR